MFRKWAIKSVSPSSYLFVSFKIQFLTLEKVYHSVKHSIRFNVKRIFNSYQIAISFFTLLSLTIKLPNLIIHSCLFLFWYRRNFQFSRRIDNHLFHILTINSYSNQPWILALFIARTCLFSLFVKLWYSNYIELKSFHIIIEVGEWCVKSTTYIFQYIMVLNDSRFAQFRCLLASLLICLLAYLLNVYQTT